MYTNMADRKFVTCDHTHCNGSISYTCLCHFRCFCILQEEKNVQIYIVSKYEHFTVCVTDLKKGNMQSQLGFPKSIMTFYVECCWVLSKNNYIVVYRTDIHFATCINQHMYINSIQCFAYISFGYIQAHLVVGYLSVGAPSAYF